MSSPAESASVKRLWLSLLIIAGVLFIDQALKIWVKTHMEYGEEFMILGLPWAYIHFVENNGMAFGLTFGGNYGKIMLSLFRVLAVFFLIYYLWKLSRSETPKGVIVSFSMILAGALGNIIDSLFYGMIFSESPYHGGLATLFPPEGGYAGFLHGKVVDMFYFPLIETILPDWVPILGGQEFVFFRPVFNVADSAISLGLINLILFQRRFFQGSHHQAPTPEVAETAETLSNENEAPKQL